MCDGSATQEKNEARTAIKRDWLVIPGMDQHEPYVAFSLLTQRELERIGSQLSVVYEIDNTREFDALLAQIDEAEARSKRANTSMQ